MYSYSELKAYDYLHKKRMQKNFKQDLFFLFLNLVLLFSSFIIILFFVMGI